MVTLAGDVQTSVLPHDSDVKRWFSGSLTLGDLYTPHDLQVEHLAQAIHDQVVGSHWSSTPTLVPKLGRVHLLAHKSVRPNPPDNLRQRLDNANDYFRRKAAEVYSDESALDLLTILHKAVVVEIADFDPVKDGIPLAKLTAANFCEIGANVIYITEVGQRFMESAVGTSSEQSVTQS